MSTNYKLNWKRNPIDERDFQSKRFLQAPPTLPTSFKLDKDIPIYDQLDIGSCVGNSICEGFRYEYAQVKGDFKFNPSRLFAYYNARKIDGWENEDSGAYIRSGFKAINKWGISSEELWPYITSKVTELPPNTAYVDGLNQLVVKYATVQKNETVIKQTIYSGAGVVIGFDVYSSFWGSWSDTTGIMPIPKSGERYDGGHAVLVIGWDDSKKCFLIQNSWGTSWGQGGYFWMPYSYLTSSHADDFWCIEEIKLVESPEPTPPPDPQSDNKEIIKTIFTKRSDFSGAKESVIVNVGKILNLPVDTKLSKNKNLIIVLNELGY